MENPTHRQVKFFFPGASIRPDFKFNFPVKYVEVMINSADNTRLDAVLFKADSARGVIYYLHGNSGGVDKWGAISKTYTDLHYDLFIFDYRGYGKSGGSIKNEAELLQDVQRGYDYLKSKYEESKIIVLGYSIGTGPAAYLAANNHPHKLILQAPYYSLSDAMHHLRPRYDTLQIPFHLNTCQYLQKTTAPVVIFHGDNDKMFYYGSSQKLKAFFKPGDKLITLKGAGHPFMDRNPVYRDSLKTNLN